MSNAPEPNGIDDLPVADKNAERARRNALSATAMLGHLCALYDRGVWEAGRLMSNLLFQLALRRPRNTPLLAQVGMYDTVRIIVDQAARGARLTPSDMSSPLVRLMFGITKDGPGGRRPAALWLRPAHRPDSRAEFDALSIDEWLDEPVIPTSERVLSRRNLIDYVRDQDGGAHSDPDAKLLKSTAYVELVNAFPMSKQSHVSIGDDRTLVWDLLPPVTLPLLRQIAHEMLCAIFSQTDIRSHVEPPCLVCLFDGTSLRGAFVPEGYPDVGPVYGRRPGVIPRRTFAGG